MKKILIFVLLLAIPFGLFARSDYFGINIGATAMVDANFTKVIDKLPNKMEEFFVSSIRYGVDLDIQLPLIDLDVTAYYAKNPESNTLGFGGFASVNLSLVSGGIFFFKVGAAVPYDYNLSLEKKFTFKNYEEKISDSINKTPIYAKATFQMKLEKVGFNISALLPLNVTLKGKWLEEYTIKQALYVMPISIGIFYRVI